MEGRFTQSILEEMLRSKMTIGTKIKLLAVSLVTFSLLLGGLSLISLSRVRSSVQVLAKDAMPGLESVDDIAADVLRIRGNAWKHIASNTAADMAAVEQSNAEIQRDIEQTCVTTRLP